MPRFREMTEQQKRYTALRTFAPAIFLEMLNRHLIDPARKSDSAYLWQVFMSDDSILPDVQMRTSIHEGFITMAELAVDNDEQLVAIVLLATAVEHILNLYFGERLVRQGLSKKDVALIIRNLNTEAKMGWLNSLIGPLEIPDDLKKRLLALMELRNAIVHYKGLLMKIDEETSYDWIRSRLEQTNFDEVIADIQELETAAEFALSSANPDRQLALEMTETMFGALPFPV
jgi:hypothetical protein